MLHPGANNITTQAGFNQTVPHRSLFETNYELE